MTNLLVDNCILRKLVKGTEISSLLKQLEFLVRGRNVRLLVPDTLKREWRKHRNEVKQVNSKQVRNLQLIAETKRTNQNPGVALTEEEIENLKDISATQVEIIDDLIERLGTSITVSEELILRIYKYRQQAKAPFHNTHKDNFNDAEILFSSAEYLISVGENALYFVSDNISDYAIGDKSNPQLHPDIIERYPELTIYYSADIRDTYKAFESLGFPRWSATKENSLRKIKNSIAVDASLPLLDQLHFYLNKRFSELSIVPKKLFAEHYPFILSDSAMFYNKPYTLTTDNRAVFDLLTSVIVENETVNCEHPDIILSKEDEKKVLEILTHLVRNHIQNIAFKDEDEVPLRFTTEAKTCSCALCLYKNFHIEELLNKIAFKTETVQFRLRTAYCLYKLRDFTRAAKMMEELLKEKNNKDLIYYVLCFNLKHLGSLIESTCWDQPQILKWAKELSSIDLEATYRECRSVENLEILKWVHEKKFYKEAYVNLQSMVGETRDLFYGQNSGYNESTRKLLEQYYEVYDFLNQNSIVYDIYSEFESLTNLFTEGLIASYGWNTSMGGRLLHFNDYSLEKIANNGKAENIKKFFARYKHNSLSYVPNENDGNRFVDKFIALLHSYSSLTLKKQEEIESGSKLKERLNELLSNYLTLISVLDLPEDSLNSAAKKLLEILCKENSSYLYRIYKSACYFLQRKGDQISAEILQNYFLAGIDRKKELNHDEYFDILDDIFERRNIQISVSAIDFGKIMDSSFGKENEKRDWYLLGIIFKHLKDAEQRHKIKDAVSQALNQNFSSHDYYLGCMFDLAAISEQFTEDYIKDVLKLIEKGYQPRPFDRKPYYTDHRIDKFVNFCFKYSIKLSKELEQKLSGLSIYYEWLLHLEEFDYSKFDPDWLYTHFTFYYKIKFRSSRKLQAHLLHLIQNDLYTELERKYMIIYCFEDR